MNILLPVDDCLISRLISCMLTSLNPPSINASSSSISQTSIRPPIFKHFGFAFKVFIGCSLVQSELGTNKNQPEQHLSISVEPQSEFSHIHGRFLGQNYGGFYNWFKFLIFTLRPPCIEHPDSSLSSFSR